MPGSMRSVVSEASCSPRVRICWAVLARTMLPVGGGSGGGLGNQSGIFCARAEVANRNRASKRTVVTVVQFLWIVIFFVPDYNPRTRMLLSPGSSTPSGAARFETTHWSIVFKAGQGAEEALVKLCRA